MLFLCEKNKCPNDAGSDSFDSFELELSLPTSEKSSLILYVIAKPTYEIDITLWKWKLPDANSNK